MSKRFLDYTPSELSTLSRTDFLDGIRAAESRVVGAYVCPLSPNYIEKVSNLELVAAFGADYITFEGFNPIDLQVPGLASKNIEDDKATKEVLQVDLGKGYSVLELKKLVARPIGALLLVKTTPDQEISGLYATSIFSEDLVRHIMEAGYDFISLAGYNQAMLLDAVSKTKAIVGDKLVIEAGIPHGPGSIDGDFPSHNLRSVSTPAFVGKLAKAGADIVDIPAVGVAPGFSIEYVTTLVDAIHENKALAAASVAHSVEGSNALTASRIAIDNKICGVDMYNVAAGGVFESVPLPEVLNQFCIAVKGKRHTYRRMAQSPLR